MVVESLVFDPAAETDVGVGAGAVIAEVLEDVSVLELPPLTLGVLLNCGDTLMIGSTVMTGAEMALETPLIRIEWP